MIYFSGISIRHLERWDFPDDNPRFASVEDCYQMFLGMHLKLMRADRQGAVNPNYQRYLACVEHFESHLRLSFEEYRNVVDKLVVLYQEYFGDHGRKSQQTLDIIGKFERLIYLYANKTFPEKVGG